MLRALSRLSGSERPIPAFAWYFSVFVETALPALAIVFLTSDVIPAAYKPLANPLGLFRPTRTGQFEFHIRMKAVDIEKVGERLAPQSTVETTDFRDLIQLDNRGLKRHGTDVRQPTHQLDHRSFLAGRVIDFL